MLLRRLEHSLRNLFNYFFRTLSAQNDNVLFVPNRNVLLTGARWGVGNGPTRDDTEGTRPAGCAEENQEEVNQSAGSGRRGGRQRTACAAHAAKPETARRPSGDSRWARPGIEPKDSRREAPGSDPNPEPGSVPRLWADVGRRVLGGQTRSASASRDSAR